VRKRITTVQGGLDLGRFLNHDASVNDEWKFLRWIDLDGVVLRGSAVRVPEPIPDTAEYLTRAEYLTKVQAGEIMQLNPKTVERLVSRGELPGYKLANRLRIRRDDLDAWIAANIVQPSIHEI
jgi:excisionase family DNA binding protein